MILEPLISLTKKGYEYPDESRLYVFLRLTESLYGILDNQLQKKVLKEYEKHRSVYDLEHNRDNFSPILLMFQVPKLLKECKYYTIPSDNRWLSIVDTFLRLDRIDEDLYPVFPKQIWSQYLDLSHKISPYLDRVPLDQRGEFLEKLYSTRKREFYMNWDLICFNEVDFKKWANFNIDMLLNAVSEDNIKVVLNILTRQSEQIKESILENSSIKEKDSIWDRFFFN